MARRQDVWVLDLENVLRAFKLKHVGGPLFIDNPKIVSGMSGSPILDADGRAIGLITLDDGPHPRVAYHLPAWLARNLGSLPGDDPRPAAWERMAAMVRSRYG